MNLEQLFVNFKRLQKQKKNIVFGYQAKTDLKKNSFNGNNVSSLIIFIQNISTKNASEPL